MLLDVVRRENFVDLPEHTRDVLVDMADTNVQPFYRFSLEVEDDEGTRLQVPMATTKVRLHAHGGSSVLVLFVNQTLTLSSDMAAVFCQIWTLSICERTKKRWKSSRRS